MQSPIHKALSSIRKSGAKTLVMGGQACILYGAAEFSRDLDLAIATGPGNLEALRQALADLDAQTIAVPTFEPEHLNSGLAVHFRCKHKDAFNLRIDIMTKMRGVDAFPELWARRTTIKTREGPRIDLLSLPDLVKAKKTQRDKDWPMIKRLLEADFFAQTEAPGRQRIEFWFKELRTPEILLQLHADYPKIAETMLPTRPCLRFVRSRDEQGLRKALLEEELEEREKDKRYWAPLKEILAELKTMRYRDKE